MKRDVDLVRAILLEVESKETPSGWVDLQIADYPKDHVSYHVKILSEAGYLEAQELTTKSGFDWKPINLTWQGHDFLDAARNKSVWQKAKKKVGDKVTSVSFDVLKSILVGIAKQELGL